MQTYYQFIHSVGKVFVFILDYICEFKHLFSVGFNLKEAAVNPFLMEPIMLHPVVC